MGPTIIAALMRTFFNSVSRRFLAIQRDSGIGFQSPTNNNRMNAVSSGNLGANEINDFTVGYDGTNNIMVFRWDFSEFDSDVWAAPA